MNTGSMQQRIDAVDALPPLRDVISSHQLSAQKSLGQNFLLDMNITDKIVRETAQNYGGEWSHVHAFEIGPGPGGLTRSLLRSGVKSVTAFEFDSRAVDALGGLKLAASGDLDIVQADAMKVNLLDYAKGPRVIVANLPYNIATPLLVGWLKQIRSNHEAYGCMALMFQKEVAERIVARPETKAYGRLAVISQWLCDVSILYELPASAFIPPPKVKSAIVFLKPKSLAVNAPSFDVVERVTATAFNQRRKMVRSSLKNYLDAIEAIGIEPTKRAENLSVDDYLSLASFDGEPQKGL